jgi:hypothetical protein
VARLVAVSRDVAVATLDDDAALDWLMTLVAVGALEDDAADDEEADEDEEEPTLGVAVAVAVLVPAWRAALLVLLSRMRMPTATDGLLTTASSPALRAPDAPPPATPGAEGAAPAKELW